MVGVVTAEDQSFADLVLGHLEWAGPVGLAEPVLGIGLNIFPVQDKGGRIGHLGQEEGLGRVDRDLDGASIDDPHPRNLQDIPRQFGVYANDISQVLVNVRRLSEWVGNAFQRPADILRSDRLAVMEDGVRTDSECVNAAVG